MTKRNAPRPAIQASSFPRVEDLMDLSRYDVHEDGDWSVPEKLQCKWNDCYAERFAGTPLCFMCALKLATFMEGIMDAMRDRGEQPPRDIRIGPAPTKPETPIDAWVYYLATGPTTVKIGTTTNLKARLSALYSEPQYVVALERGSYALERERHKQFATELIGREKFTVSKRLQRHIEGLRATRDELLKTALMPKLDR